ncbi:mechanosensitive ion channel family protein [Truepera radiovictrix]|uniref:MscS Mechanosensitive ion channel n=1 Tax=Truepera radiovictrix (strain DSM 17093 / CIP 108686 / LMG 22925 / RQ-24) TaxID=649638 RepID=D7CR77_TRURR|nr:mechanosensitive ion channel family protein [Truepera radiovictrix]ADI15165.1 MscS Mechanosensitive ion channel [Truepera radiovictrix DSM 17093]WMT56282.1 mechanosensitive ion channel family protein [Truepera radiovictrix]
MANLLNSLFQGTAPADEAAPDAPTGAATADPTGGAEGTAAELLEVPLLELNVIAEVQDTTWLTELWTDVQTAPLQFFGNLFVDLGIGLLLFGALWFFIDRWARAARDVIAKRELWDDAQKEAERGRTMVLRRYLITASAVLGALLTLGLFALRHRVPILQTLALAVRDWLLGGGLGRIISVIIVGALIYVLLRLVRKTARALTPISGQRFERQVARAATIRNVVESSARIVLITFFVLFVLAQAGANVSALLTGVGILGLAVSFGAQSLVKDVITGFFILAEDQFGVGDVVTIGNFSGAVESVNLRITTLRSLDGQVHVIPNGQIDKVTVASKDWSRAVVDVEVSYRSDLDRALEVITDEAEKLTEALGWSWRVVGLPEVTGVEALGASGVVIRVLFRTLPKEQWGVSREFRRRIKNRLEREGIEIPYPHVTLYWGEGQKPALGGGPEARAEHAPREREHS